MTETPNLVQAHDKLCRAMRMNQLIAMAAESGIPDDDEAIATGTDLLQSMLKEVEAILKINIEKNKEMRA